MNIQTILCRVCIYLHLHHFTFIFFLVASPYELDYCPTVYIPTSRRVVRSSCIAHLGIPDSFGLCLRSGTISNIQSGKHMGEHCEDIGPSLTIIVLALPVLLTSFAPSFWIRGLFVLNRAYLDLAARVYDESTENTFPNVSETSRAHKLGKP
jgi:hypothetical protein